MQFFCFVFFFFKKTCGQFVPGMFHFNTWSGAQHLLEWTCKIIFTVYIKQARSITHLCLWPLWSFIYIQLTYWLGNNGHWFWEKWILAFLFVAGVGHDLFQNQQHKASISFSLWSESRTIWWLSRVANTSSDSRNVYTLVSLSLN